MGRRRRPRPIANVLSDLGTVSPDSLFRGFTYGLDITSTLQGYIDGTNNYGFILGQTGYAAYNNGLALTEYSVPFMRPTLILQYWNIRMVGTLVELR